MPSKNSVFEALKVVTTKTLLLKHSYRRQGISKIIHAGDFSPCISIFGGDAVLVRESLFALLSSKSLAQLKYRFDFLAPII